MSCTQVGRQWLYWPENCVRLRQVLPNFLGWSRVQADLAAECDREAGCREPVLDQHTVAAIARLDQHVDIGALDRYVEHQTVMLNL